ncbi:MAG: hypothetical protein NG712_03850 [Omnitrophica bacterium]|nr:hypothetical protein [Candidatus Omnitrophota bacterium]
MKLNVKVFGLTCGVIWAGAILVMTIISGLTNTVPGAYDGYAGRFIKGLTSIYSGYSISLLGAIIGALWAGFTNFIFGTLFAWIYNRGVDIFS